MIIMPPKARRAKQKNLKNALYLVDPKDSIRKREILSRHKGKTTGKKPPAFSIQVTPEISNFANHFPNDSNGISAMISILKSRITLEKEKPSVAEHHYMLQSAHDIIALGKIPVPYTKRGARHGCNAMCVALAACLKAKKIPYKFVRTVARWETDMAGNSHSVILFKLGNRWFIADLFRNKDIMQQVGQRVSKKIRELKKLGKWKEGKSPEDLGMFSYDDFDIHNPDAKS